VVEPSDLGLSGIDEVVQDQQPGQLVASAGFFGARALELGQVLQVTQRRGPLGLDEALYVDARHRDCERELDDKLIARGIATVDRGRPPVLDLGPTLVGRLTMVG